MTLKRKALKILAQNRSESRMEQTISVEQRIQEVLINDPLFQVIRETPTEQLFLSEPYLNELIEKKYYYTRNRKLV